GELYAELLAQLGERVELVQLTNPVPAVTGLAPFRDDQGLRLEVAEHARRPTRAPTRLPDGHPCPHPGLTLSESCQGSRAPTCPHARTDPRGARRRPGDSSRPRSRACPRS